jgi:hypothetical protein
MSGTYYAGDVGVEILIGPIGMGAIDGSTITSARIMATSPRGHTVELAATIASQAVGSITLRHLTDGSIGTPDTWRLRAWCYVGASAVLSTLEILLPVSPRRVAPPT